MKLVHLYWPADEQPIHPLGVQAQQLAATDVVDGLVEANQTWDPKGEHLITPVRRRRLLDGQLLGLECTSTVTIESHGNPLTTTWVHVITTLEPAAGTLKVHTSAEVP